MGFGSLIDLFRAGKCSAESLVDGQKRLIASAVALSDRPDDHAAVYERAVLVAWWIEEVAKQRREVGRLDEHDWNLFRYHHLDMRIKLHEARQRHGAQVR